MPADHRKLGKDNGGQPPSAGLGATMMRALRGADWRPTAALLGLGAGGQLCQAVLVRELLMIFHGNELSMGVALAAWLLWAGLGSLLCGRLAGRLDPLRAAAIAAAGLLALMPLTVILLRDVRGLLAVMPGEALSFLDALTVGAPIMAPVGALWGALFVCLARLRRTASGREAEAAGAAASGPVRAYALEAAGNTIGGLLFSLLLVRILDPLSGMILAGCLLALPLGLVAPSRSAPRRLLFGLCLLAAAALPLFERFDLLTHARHWRRFAPEHELIAIHPSRYGRITVARRKDQISFHQSGNLVFSIAGEETAHALEEQESAILAHLALAQHPAPRRALMIGGGLRGVLREVLAHPLEAVDLVEIDPDLIRAALPHLSASTRAALADTRVRLITGDGRLAVKFGAGEYDLIIVDAPDPTTAALNRFYTREFFLEARRRLAPGGVLVIGVSSVAGLHEPAVVHRNATLLHTLQSVFAHVLPAGERLVLFFATDAPNRISVEPRLLLERHRASGAESPRFPPTLLFTLLQETPLRRQNWVLSRHGRRPDADFDEVEGAPLFPPSLEEQTATAAGLDPVDERRFINSDFLPIAYYYSLILWNRQVRGRHDAVLTGIARVRSWWLIPAVGAALAVSLALRRGRTRPETGRRWALGLAVFTTGFSAMATQVALLFAFQSQYGFVYEMIGLIVALFMAGLAAGAMAGGRIVPAGAADAARARRVWRRLMMVQTAITFWAAALAWGLPAVAGLASPGAIILLFAAMTAASGFWNGMNFPPALACAADLESRGGIAIGWIYGSELLGASLGALLAGVVVIPILGIPASCLLSAGLTATAVGAMIIARKIREN